MENAYWSIENAGWSTPDGALVTPWSAHGLSVVALPSARSAAEVLRLPSREDVLSTAVPAPRAQAEQPAAR